MRKTGDLGRNNPHFSQKGPELHITEPNQQSEALYQAKRMELLALRQAFSLVIDTKQQLLKSLSLKTSKHLEKSEIRGLATEIEDLYSLLSSSHSTISLLIQRHRALAAELHCVEQETALQRYRSEEETATLALKTSMVGLT